MDYLPIYLGFTYLLLSDVCLSHLLIYLALKCCFMLFPRPIKINARSAELEILKCQLSLLNHETRLLIPLKVKMQNSDQRRRVGTCLWLCALLKLMSKMIPLLKCLKDLMFLLPGPLHLNELSVIHDKNNCTFLDNHLDL